MVDKKVFFISSKSILIITGVLFYRIFISFTFDETVEDSVVNLGDICVKWQMKVGRLCYNI